MVLRGYALNDARPRRCVEDVEPIGRFLLAGRDAAIDEEVAGVGWAGVDIEEIAAVERIDAQGLHVGVIDQRHQRVGAVERLQPQHRIGRRSGRVEMNLKAIRRVGSGQGKRIGIAQRAVVAVHIHRLQSLEGV